MYNSGLSNRYKGALLHGINLYVRSASQNAPGTIKCPGRFLSLRSEQGAVPFAPLCGYSHKAKGVQVTPFAYFTVLRTTPQLAGVFFDKIFKFSFLRNKTPRPVVSMAREGEDDAPPFVVRQPCRHPREIRLCDFDWIFPSACAIIPKHFYL